MVRLSSETLHLLDARVSVPTYDRDKVSGGWVHIGPGAFHRAHQAMYVDRCLEHSGDLSWGICTVGLLPRDLAIHDVLADQQGLYTLVTVDPEGSTEVRVVGSVIEHLHAPHDPEAVVATLARPRTRVVSLTITEGGYAVDDATRGMRGTGALGPSVAVPANAFEYLVAALAERRKSGTPPFTVLSCDNIQGNGEATRAAVVAVAERLQPELGAWIAEHVAFPNSMVDRITPATTDEVRAEVHTYGVDDDWPVRAEAFTQWVVEDRFSAGRPALERVGVQLVPDVVPYEKLKLRVLNACHQAMGYLGLLSGATYVHEVSRDAVFAAFLRSYLYEEAVPTLDPAPGVDVYDYCEKVLARFASEAIQDTLARQVVDGSDRVTKFLLPVLADRLRTGGSISCCALILAAWSFFLDSADRFDPVDRRLESLLEAVAREREGPGAFLEVRDVFADLGSHPRLRKHFVEGRTSLRDLGPAGAMERLIRRTRPTSRHGTNLEIGFGIA